MGTDDAGCKTGLTATGYRREDQTGPRSAPSLTVVALSLLLAAGCTKSADRVVVYSAQDEDYAVRVLDGLDLGVKVEPKFDTEANKSVGLVAELQAEAGRPRCDVHWNNEPLGTIRLARQGLYEPYSSPESANYPAAPGRAYAAFAERARVLIVNTKRVPAGQRPASLFDLTSPRFRGVAAIAKPQFGTTATHAACLFEVLGPDGAKDFFRALQVNGVTVVAGNKAVAVGVAKGDFAVGLTDSDDAMLELLAGRDVAIVRPDADTKRPRFGTLYLPNTLALVKGGPNPAAGRRLIDRLLSKEAERTLAEGGGHQLPLRTDLQSLRPTVLQATPEGARMQPDFDKAADLWPEAQAFLRDTFAR